jgi:hypothetical protein
MLEIPAYQNIRSKYGGKCYMLCVFAVLRGYYATLNIPFGKFQSFIIEWQNRLFDAYTIVIAALARIVNPSVNPPIHLSPLLAPQQGIWNERRTWSTR